MPWPQAILRPSQRLITRIPKMIFLWSDAKSFFLTSKGRTIRLLGWGNHMLSCHLHRLPFHLHRHKEQTCKNQVKRTHAVPWKQRHPNMLLKPSATRTAIDQSWFHRMSLKKESGNKETRKMPETQNERSVDGKNNMMEFLKLASARPMSSSAHCSTSQDGHKMFQSWVGCLLESVLFCFHVYTECFTLRMLPYVYNHMLPHPWTHSCNVKRVRVTNEDTSDLQLFLKTGCSIFWVERFDSYLNGLFFKHVRHCVTSTAVSK